jgi:uncharacterized membrane protein YuzA (DUF378 family)
MTGTSVALNGAPFDFLYAFAGVCGIYAMVKYWKVLFTKQEKQSSQKAIS